MLETLCAKVSLKLCLKESGCKSFQSIFSLLVRSLFAEKEKGKKGEGMEEHRLSEYSIQMENAYRYMIANPGTDFHWLVYKSRGHYAVASSPMTKWLPSTPKDESSFEITASPTTARLSEFRRLLSWLSHLFMDHYSHIPIQPVPSSKSCVQRCDCVRLAWWACRDSCIKVLKGLND